MKTGYLNSISPRFLNRTNRRVLITTWLGTALGSRDGRTCRVSIDAYEAQPMELQAGQAQGFIRTGKKASADDVVVPKEPNRL